jgi:hypothetical protein
MLTKRSGQVRLAAAGRAVDRVTGGLVDARGVGVPGQRRVAAAEDDVAVEQIAGDLPLGLLRSAWR